MGITAVIPVREGSTRVKNKNIKKFAGNSLLENKINQLKRVKEIDEIVVSSDSEVMLQIARDYRVTARRRPYEYCDEKTRSFNDVVRYIAQNDVNTDIMIWAPCVCPLVSSEKIREGILLYQKIIRKEIEGDSVATAALFKQYLFDEKGPLNFSVEHHVPSQQLPDWHYITNGFFIAKTMDMYNWKFVYGPHPCLCEVSKFEAIDIDDEYDFVMAEFVYDYLRRGNRI